MNNFEFESPIARAINFYRYHCKGLNQTIEFNKNVNWTPESQAIIYGEIQPQVKVMEEIINKLAQAEEQAEIDNQLAIKPVANIKVEPVDNYFIIKDATTGAEISKWDAKVIIGYLEIMHKMQTENSTPVQTQSPKEKQPIAEKDNEEEPF